jgi:segregation and condensation protein B
MVNRKSNTSAEAATQPVRIPTDPAIGPAPSAGVVQLIEALLFMGGAPLTAEKAAAVIRGLETGVFNQAIGSLSREYRRQGRPYAVQTQDDGYLLCLRSQWKWVEERVRGLNRQARLSVAAIDVLSLVAYRQPMSKQEIDSIRGTDSGALLRQLLRRTLIKVAEAAGEKKEVRYQTTERFLELFQLKSLEELPQTQDLHAL